jgi:hypothetical protein
MRVQTWFLFSSTLLTGFFLLGVLVIFCALAFQDMYHETQLMNFIDVIIMEIGYAFSLGICIVGGLFTIQINKLKQAWEY